MNRSMLVLSMLTLSGACMGTEDPDDPPSVALRLALTANETPNSSPPGSLVMQDEDGTPFVIERAEANVRHIQLDLPDGQDCGNLELPAPAHCESDKVTVPGPFVVDLVAGTSSPSLEALRVPAGVYERVDVRFDDAEPGDGLVQATQALAHHSLHAVGHFEHEGEETRFELLLKFNEDARFESPSGVRLGEAGGREALLLLDISHWFEALPVTRCLDEDELRVEDGVLRIDDERSQCSGIESELKDAIKNSGQLGGA